MRNVINSNLILAYDNIAKIIISWIPFISMVILAFSPILGWKMLGSAHDYQFSWSILGAVSGITFGIVGVIILSSLKSIICSNLESQNNSTTNK